MANPHSHIEIGKAVSKLKAERDELAKLLKEARKIMLASSARTLNKDFLQRSADCLKKLES